jgi:hypothetical protein
VLLGILVARLMRVGARAAAYFDWADWNEEPVLRTSKDVRYKHDLSFPTVLQQQRQAAS